MEINNNNRDDDKRVENQREQSRLEAERKQKLEPMKTFEAKLSEKTSVEQAGKDSQQNQLKQQKREEKNRESILKKVIGTQGKAQEEALDHARIQGFKHDQEREDSQRESKFENAIQHREDDFAPSHKETQKSDSSKEVSGKKEHHEEGHKRVAERSQHDGQSGGQGSASSDSHSGGQQGSGQNDSRDKKSLFARDRAGRQGLTALSKGQGGYSGFQQNARGFTEQNIDEMVSAVNVGINAEGDEFFEVELSDPYFEGVKIQSLRQPEGVVLKITCPNVAVRSTFLFNRPLLYERLQAKNVSVFRIDIV